MLWYTRIREDYFTRQGRIGRRTFIQRNLILFGVMLLLSAFLGLVGAGDTLSLLLWVPFIFASLTLVERRLHDTGHKAWWCLLFLVPILGFFLTIYLALASGTGDNAYGQALKK